MDTTKDIWFLRNIKAEEAGSFATALLSRLRTVGYLQPLVVSFCVEHTAGDAIATCLGSILYRHDGNYINRDLKDEFNKHACVIVLFDDETASKMFHFLNRLD